MTTYAHITREDVINVANRIKLTVSEKQINEILEEYPAWESNDPTGTWDLIVENMIYSFKKYENEQ